MHNSKILSALRFASLKHKNQFRKGQQQIPFINHPIRVANLLAENGESEDTDLLTAAILHDAVEDTDTTFAEIETLFGKAVCELVIECTDDKSLLSYERKQKQIDYAPKASTRAKKLKLADKICNVIDIRENPPKGWATSRKLAYLSWAEAVFTGLKGTNAQLDKIFEKELELAKNAMVNLV